jgi:hypothetical protein
VRVKMSFAGAVLAMAAAGAVTPSIGQAKQEPVCGRNVSRILVRYEHTHHTVGDYRREAKRLERKYHCTFA